MGIEQHIDISAKQRETILTLLERYLPDTTAWVYGSRGKWTSRPQSDLDLVVFATSDQRHWIGSLREAFEDSDLPFRVELFVWDDVPEEFRKQIKAEYSVLVESSDHTSRREAIPLGNCILMNESTYSPTEAWPFVNYLDTGNVTENRILHVQHLVLDKDKLPSRARRKAQPGDIIYSTVRPNQKHFGLLRDIPDNFLVSTGFAVFRGKEKLADTGFIYWFVSQDHIVERLHTIAEHSTSTYPSIRPIDIERLQIALPPLPEQRTIAHILGTLDDKIELNRRMNETLEAMARALFKSWFVDFDPVRAKMAGRDPGLPKPLADLFPERLVDSEIGEIPEGWEVSQIGQEVDVLGGATPSTKELVYWKEGEHCWATPKDLSKLSSPVLLGTERKVTDAGVEKISSGLLPIGTVLLSSRAPIGYLAIASVPTAVNQGFIAMICRKRLSNLFVLCWCYENLDHIRGIAGGSTFSEISKKVFRPILVAVPSREVLRVYHSIAGPLYGSIVANTRENSVLAQIRDVLLPKLVSGEIRVRDAERIVETAI